MSNDSPKSSKVNFVRFTLNSPSFIMSSQKDTGEMRFNLTNKYFTLQ